MTDKPDPSKRSSECAAMLPQWEVIGDILAGAPAIRAKGERYLPKYPAEGPDEYRQRLNVTPWRPEFADALAGLVAKPFAKDISISGDDDERLSAIGEDADLNGNSLTLFARRVFASGIANGLAAVLVDHTPANGPTQRDERLAGARPYLVHVDAKNIIAAYFEKIGGVMRCIHARLAETVITRNGFVETITEQIRVLEPGSSQLWVKSTNGEWIPQEPTPVSLPYVPIVFLFFGERKGQILTRPPLYDLAEAQLELYRALSRQEEILTYAGSPMLAANGFAPPEKPISVGPRSVLFAPPSDGGSTSWSFIQPDAANIKEVRSQIESIISDMRRMGHQPLVQRAGGVTATASAIDNAKAHSVLQSWAMILKDGLEQAYAIAADYLRITPSVELEVSTDFSVEPFAQAPLQALKDARASRDISWRTYVSGLRRFDVLPADFDIDYEEQEIAEEGEPVVPEQEIDPLTGQPLSVVGSATDATDRMVQ